MVVYGMKKLALTLLLILGISLAPVGIYAQEDTTEQVTQEETTTEDTTETVDISQESSNISFLSILFATLTPALFFVIAYLIIKMTKQK